MQHIKHKTDCRLCGSLSLDHVLPIRPSPIGDAFVTAERRSEPQELYPLDCYLCLDCGHLQNLDVVDADVLFRDYTYRTSVSLGLVEHFKRYARSVVESLGIPNGSLVVEMGSNDGSLLKAFRNEGMRVQGIDPARDIAASATAEGVPTARRHFSPANLPARSGPNRVRRSCSAPTTSSRAYRQYVRCRERRSACLLADDGAFVFEVSYIVDMIDHMVFDTIYHEHVSHHALIPLETFLNKHDMTLFDVGAHRDQRRLDPRLRPAQIDRQAAAFKPKLSSARFRGKAARHHRARDLSELVCGNRKVQAQGARLSSR